MADLPSSRSKLVRVLASVVLTVGLVVGVLLVAGVVVVRGTLLDAGTYRGALVEADAYERTYTEVLADPELAATADALIGQVTIMEVTPTQARALVTAALRWTVPPSTLQQGTETVIDRTLAYVRGDVPRLDVDIDVSEVLDRIDTTAVTEVRSALADAVDTAVASLPSFEAAVRDLADEIAAGRVPAAIPVVGGTEIDTAAVTDVILDVLGDRADEELRRRVLAAVESGDERDALIDAAALLVTEHATRASEQLRSSAEDGRELDVVTAVADRANRSVADVVATLDGVRNAASWFRVLVAVAGAVVALGCVVGLVLVHRDDPRRAGVLVAAGIAVAAAAVAVIWLAVTATVGDPLERAVDEDGWRLPAGLRAVLADVQRAVAADLAGSVWRIVAVLVLTAAAVAVTLVLVPLLRGVSARRGLVLALAAGGGVALVTGVLASGESTDEPMTCNGHVELCDRRYDEVAYAATHNSMSSPDVVSVWPEHDGDIAAQLDAGIRALLIDAKYWTTVESAQALVAAEPLMPASVADAVFGTLGDRTRGRDGTFLCHIHCAFGEIDFTEAMGTVREFLVDNPREVVTLIIQDEIAVEDTAGVMREAGLEPFLHVHPDGERWATLGELIELDERLVVLAENEGPPPVWYHQGFELMQETPFLFREPEDMSCVPNRGDPDATLFQLNHWVQRVAPDRVDAVIVNAHDFVVDRALRCRDERGLMPNFVAVNFYNLGDLVGAVDTLNGVG